MVTEVIDTYNIVDQEDVITVNDQPELVSVSDTPDGAVVVTDTTDDYNVIDSTDSLDVTDAVDAVDVTDPVIINNITINKPVAIQRLSPVAGVDIGNYKMVAISSGLAVLADNNISTLSRNVLGLSDEATTTGNQTSIVVIGEVVNGLWNFTIDSPVFLSTSGDVTQIIPITGFLLKVGVALAPDTLMVDVQMPIHLN